MNMSSYFNSPFALILFVLFIYMLIFLMLWTDVVGHQLVVFPIPHISLYFFMLHGVKIDFMKLKQVSELRGETAEQATCLIWFLKLKKETLGAMKEKRPERNLYKALVIFTRNDNWI